jgi:hypothetical protein
MFGNRIKFKIKILHGAILLANDSVRIGIMPLLDPGYAQGLLPLAIGCGGLPYIPESS